MKRLINILGILFLVNGMVFTSCSKDKPESPNGITPPKEVEKPTALTVSHITGTSAVLSWTSDADSCQIIVGKNDTYISIASSYPLTNLTPSTYYSWKIRAVKSGKYSQWTAENIFKTLEKPQLPNTIVVQLEGYPEWTANSFITTLDSKDVFLIMAPATANAGAKPAIFFQGTAKVNTDDSAGYRQSQLSFKYVQESGSILVIGDWILFYDGKNISSIEVRVTDFDPQNLTISGTIDGSLMKNSQSSNIESRKIHATFKEVQLSKKAK